ncbi:MAG: 30S ribosome-binding factor RbfA [Clostridia bacterium]|nr:30S ribosome-binding factor RbfA [Clostridia bacterium]
MENVRQERANAEIIKALSYIINQKVNDPRIKNLFITLTYAKTSADFRHCKVGFSVLNANKHDVQKRLQKIEGFLKRELIAMVKLPFAPELEFVVDVGEDNSERINDILKTLDIPAEIDNDEEN